MSVEHQHLLNYRELFCHRRDVYAQQLKDGSYFLKRTAVSEGVVGAHLAGHLTAGWYALSTDNTARWVALDADTADGLERLQAAWRKLEAMAIPSYLECSRRGGHLWTFFEPVSARAARRLIQAAVGSLDGLELYPKQDHLAAGMKVGSLVRGPLGLHRLSGQRYPFVDPISLRPVSNSLSGQLGHLQTVRRVNHLQVAEQLADLVDLSRLSHSRPPTAEVRLPNQNGLGRSPLEQVKENIGDLYSFVSHYVDLDQAGKGHCPFHPPDHHPSFAVNRQSGHWICFHEYDPERGRYLGGDAIDFYMRLKGLSYREALRELRNQVSG